MSLKTTIAGVRVTVHTNCRPVRWMSKLGLTLGSHIFLSVHAWEVWPALVAHEYGHVLQWREMGTWRFLWAYLGGLLSHGYGLKHPLERQAHEGEAYWMDHPDVIAAVRAIGGRL